MAITFHKSASGHSLRIHPASEPTFVRCWSNSVLNIAAQRMTRSANSDQIADMPRMMRSAMIRH